MVIDRLLNRFTLIMTLVLVVIGLSACYKDAGNDMEPTSNRVDLSDIAPTIPATPTPIVTATPTAQPLATTTRTLVPTTTPADFVSAEPPTAEPTESLPVEEPGLTPTGTVAFAPSFTAMPTEPGIATPGMSDIQSSPTITPTLNPAFQPTPTAIPIEENPCVHVVKPNDTLYSIAQGNDVSLGDLVSANPDLLGGNPNTTLQIGWQLHIPGCYAPGTEPTATGEATVEVTPTAGSEEGFPKTHVVQSGETIYSIGRLYGVDPQAIIDANNLVNPNLIQPGDTLVIPAPQ